MSPSRDEPPSGSSTPKLAIKGFSLASKSSTSNKPNAKTGAKFTPPSTLGKRPRSTFGHHDSGSDSEYEDGFTNGGGRGRGKGEVEVVTAFGEQGAIKENEKKKEGPLVIPRLENRDWRAEARARSGKNLLPPEVQAAQEAARRERDGKGEGKMEGVDVVNSKDGEIVWGLNVRKREKVEVEENGNGVASTGDGDANAVESKTETEPEEPRKPKTADEEALEALLGTRREKKGPELIIPTAASPPPDSGPITEQDAYRRAILAAPDVSTLEDYERVPVEEFGAALLRGMGWKGEKEGQVKEVKRRPNLLGLGAKELKDAEELGAWVQKSDVKRLNGGDRRQERRPKTSDYRREKERRDERREERGGGSYRRDRERDRDGRR